MSSPVEFHTLNVAAVEPQTDESVAVTFAIPEHLRARFRHVPGQHVVVRKMLDGDDVRRTYSICSPAADGAAVRVGVKRIPNGVFSTFATTKLKAGDTLDVMAPIGEFTLDPSRTGRYVAIVAGSGITPVLSMIQSALAQNPASDFTLIYGNRTSVSIMFLEDLEDLKNRYPDRFQVVHILSREPHQVPLFQGRIDADKLRSLASTLIDPTAIDRWFLCGPLEMVETARSTLAELGVADDAVSYELFFDQRVEGGAREAVEEGEGSVTVQVTIDGRTSVVKAEPDGPPLLDYARSVRAEVPFACKGGMCATCKAKLITGEVTLTKNYALTDEELAAGYILTCQAHPVSDEVALTYDVHGGVGR
ncbi:MAG: phenylacetate-CoA oxygenase/reductase subunit PaaK [Acidimicrobiia bacterium]|nr:phenylacetate-CoA oxygenase/reductase subunit PaaK [Acidimicrobiia bacterium]